MNRVSADVAALQQNAAVDQKHSMAVVSNLERKVEECIAVSGNSMNAVAARSSKLEDLVRDTELAIRSSVNETKGEVGDCGVEQYIPLPMCSFLVLAEMLCAFAIHVFLSFTAPF
jgi:hypothetical protein